MVILPKEYRLENLEENLNDADSQNGDSSSSTASADDQQDDSRSITPRVNDNHGYIEEMDGNSIRKFIPANSHINVENSNDVVIGSLTQFHGPVTIVQNGNSRKILTPGHGGYITESDGKYNGTLNISPTSDPPATFNPPQQSTNTYPTSHSQYNPIDQFWTSKRRCLVILAAIAVPLFIVALSTTLTLNNSTRTASVPGLLPPGTTVTGDETIKPLGNHKHLQITREKWGGRPMNNNTRPLQHPIQFVIISHTAGVWCDNYKDCSDAVQILQSLHVSRFGSPDIGYNFLIGGDGNIYVGRGWDIRNFHADKNIGISFIGNFVYDFLRPGMIEACQDLLEEGVETGKLATNYTLIGHNQTYATQSPGDHAFAVIKTWPHFKNGDFLDLDV